MDRPRDALAWLEGHWGRQEPTRRRLLSDALAALGRAAESAEIRRELFEASLSTFDLQRWLDQLPEAARAAARARARGLALAHADAVESATLLLALDDTAAAEQALVKAGAAIDGRDYGSLVPLAGMLRERGCPRGETAVLRALLSDNLARAEARAYGHAARYLRRLREIAAAGEPLDPLAAHVAFEQYVKATHPRKVAFWQQVAQLAGPEPTNDIPGP